MNRKPLGVRPRGFCAGFLGLAVLLLPNGASASSTNQTPTEASCRPRSQEHVIVSNVGERLQLTLADGRLLRIAGIEAPGPTPADPDLDDKTRAWLAARLEGQEVIIAPLDARADRWGRVPVSVLARSGAQDPTWASVEEGLLQQGLARVVPDQHKIACAKRLFQAETAARSAEAGLWADPYYAVISATDATAFEERAGSFILAEGKVTEVRDIAARTVVLFGPRQRSNLSVTILQRNVKIFEAAGLHFHELIGQTLRVRGLLETRFGPELELTDPSDVERIADAPGEMAKPMLKAGASVRP